MTDNQAGQYAPVPGTTEDPSTLPEGGQAESQGASNQARLTPACVAPLEKPTLRDPAVRKE
jgi:hypothetical protein